MHDSQDKSAHSEVNYAGFVYWDALPVVNVLFQVLSGSNMETGERLLSLPGLGSPIATVDRVRQSHSHGH